MYNMHIFSFYVFNRKKILIPYNLPNLKKYIIVWLLTWKLHYKLPLNKEFDKVVLN